MSKLKAILALSFYATTTFLYWFAFDTDAAAHHRAKMSAEGDKLYSSFGGKWKFLTMLDLV